MEFELEVGTSSSEFKFQISAFKFQLFWVSEFKLQIFTLSDFRLQNSNVRGTDLQRLVRHRGTIPLTNFTFHLSDFRFRSFGIQENIANTAIFASFFANTL